MQSSRPVNALSVCAAVLVLSGGEAHAFMVGRRGNFEVGQPLDVRRKDAAASPHSSFSLYDADERDLQLQPPIFSFEDNQEASFVQASGDDDSDDDSDDDEKRGDKEKSKGDKKKGEKGSGHGGHGEHGEHGSHEHSSKGKSEKEEEKKAEHKDELPEPEKEGPGHKKEKHEEEEEEEKKEKREEPHKPENLLTSPQEQSKFIMSSMNNATQESYGAMEKLVKVMDYLHGVVSLLNQIIQLAPPSPTFSETVILESPGKKISLKALLDEAANVRSSVDALFTMLMSAKHSIIGAINRAIPARPPAAAPAAAAAAAAAATTPPPPK